MIISEVKRLPYCEKQGKHPCTPEQDVGCLNNEKSEILSLNFPLRGKDWLPEYCPKNNSITIKGESLFITDMLFRLPISGKGISIFGESFYNSQSWWEEISFLNQVVYLIEWLITMTITWKLGPITYI